MLIVTGLVYALCSDISLTFIATMLIASALFGVYLLQSAKAHFTKGNRKG